MLLMGKPQKGSRHVLQSWLLWFLNWYFQDNCITKVWCRTKVMAIPQPGKPQDAYKCYQCFSLLCDAYMLMERLFLMSNHEVIKLQLPFVQADCRWRWCTQDEVFNLIQDFEDAFKKFKKIETIFIDLSAAYITVWHVGLTTNLLHVVLCKPLVQFIMEMIANQSFILQDGNSQPA